MLKRKIANIEKLLSQIKGGNKQLTIFCWGDDLDGISEETKDAFMKHIARESHGSGNATIVLPTEIAKKNCLGSVLITRHELVEFSKSYGESR